VCVCVFFFFFFPFFGGLGMGWVLKVAL